MSDSPKYNTFRCCFDRLVTGVKPAVETVARNSFAKNLISSENLSAATNQQNEKVNRATELLQLILNKVEQNTAHFDTFVTILGSVPTLKELADKLIAELAKWRLDNDPNFALKNQDPQEFTDLARNDSETCASKYAGGSSSKIGYSSAGSKVLAENDDALLFVCHCGNNCSFDDYLESKCCGSLENSFPFLRTDHLSKSDKDKLARKLLSEANRISSRFSNLISDTFDVLKEQQTPLDKLVAVINTVAQQTDHPNTIPVEHSDELRTMDSVYDVQTFLVTHRYISFINYGILETIIKRLVKEDSSSVVKEMQNYLTDFCNFCKRSVFEVPRAAIKGSAPACDPQKNCEYVIKVNEETWFKASAKSSVQSIFTFEDLIAVEVKLAECIGVHPARVLLQDISRGCVELSFVVLSPCSNIPFSTLQTEHLSRLGINIIVQPTGTVTTGVCENAERKGHHQKVNTSTLQFDHSVHVHSQTLWQPTTKSGSEDNILTAVNDDTKYWVNDDTKCNTRPPTTVNDSGLDKAWTSSMASTSGARRPTITDQDPLAPVGPVQEPIGERDEVATNGGRRRYRQRLAAQSHTQRRVTKARSEENIVAATLGLDSTATANVNTKIKMPDMSPVQVDGALIHMQETDTSHPQYPYYSVMGNSASLVSRDDTAAVRMNALQLDELKTKIKQELRDEFKKQQDEFEKKQQDELKKQQEDLKTSMNAFKGART